MSMRDLTVIISEKGYKELQAKVTRLEQQLAALSKKPAKVKIDSSGVDAINKKLSNMGRLLKVGVVTAFAYKGAKAFGAWIDKVEELNNKVTQTGLSSDMYQSLVKQAQESGLSVEAITSAMDKFNKVSAANKDTRSADERLLGLANHLQGIEDPAQRASEAIKYLGRSGTQLLPIFMKGAEGVKAITAELKANGSILSAETIERAAKVDDMFDKINRTIGEISNRTFSGISEELLNMDGQLNSIFETIKNMDWESIGKGIAYVLKPLVAFSELLMKALEEIGKYQSAKTATGEEAARQAYQEGLFTTFAGGQYNRSDSKSMIDSKNWMYKNIDSHVKDTFEKAFDGLTKSGGPVKELMDYIDTNTSSEGFKDTFGIIDDLFSKALKDSTSTTASFLNEWYRNTFGRSFSLPTTKNGGSKVTDRTTYGFVATKEKGGRGGGTSSANFSDPFLSTLIHFKNEFIVFADKLLRAQGIIKGGGVSAAAGGGDINVSVTVNTGVAGDPHTVGSAVANEIVQELKKLVTANNNAITAINKHADVVKQATGKTASVITPASPPIYQFPT